MLCVILSKHNVELNIFAHVKGDDCGERTLGSLSGDGVIHSGAVNPVCSLVGLPKGEGHAGLSRGMNLGRRSQDVRSQGVEHKYAQREKHSSAPICDRLQRLCR